MLTQSRTLQMLFLSQRRLPLILDLKLSPVALPLAACALRWGHQGCALSTAFPTSSVVWFFVVLSCSNSMAADCMASSCRVAAASHHAHNLTISLFLSETGARIRPDCMQIVLRLDSIKCVRAA